MEIGYDFSPRGTADPGRGRHEQLEAQLALYQKAMGHDLHNQMVALQGLAQMLATELGPDVAPDVRALVGRLASLSLEADENMQALAALGRLCRQPGPAETLDLGKLAHEAATELKILFKEQPVDYHFQRDMPTVTTARAPLYQLLTQLLRNAFQAAVPGQPLTVEVGARRAESGGVEVRVGDSGRGMSEFQLRQAQAALAGEPGGGTDLGLVLVRQVVAGWCGAVHVRSEPGRGTVVTILARTW
jgi:signal transduction histidine kinase